MRKLCYFAAILCLGVFLASGVQADLVAHYTFEEGSGTTAGDSSGYGTAANGTFVGSGISWVAGKTGDYAVDLSGSSWIDCGNAAKFNITGQISISAWIKAGTVMFPQGGGYGMLVSKGNTAGWRVCQYINDPTMLWGVNGDNGNIYTTNYPEVPVPLNNEWHHIAVTFDEVNDRIRMYVDGIMCEQSNAFPILTNSYKVILGANDELMPYGGYYWVGTFDDVRIYNHALTQEEVYELILPGLLDPTPVPSECVLHLDANASNSVVDPNGGQPVAIGGIAKGWLDQSGNGLNAILAYGDPTLESAAFPNGNHNVIRFDGDDGLIVDPNSANFGKLSSTAYSIYAVGRIDERSLARTFFANSNQTAKGYRLGITSNASSANFNKAEFYTNYFGSQTAAEPLVAGRYYLLSGTVSTTGEKKFYINGQLVSETIGTTAYESSPVVSIGTLDIGREFLAGDIAEIKVYRGVDATVHASETTTLMDKYQIDTSEPEVPYADPDTVTLSAMTLSRTTAAGVMDISERWNTYYPDAAWDIAIYEGAILTDPNTLNSQVFNDLNYLMIEIPLQAGQQRTFSWHVARGGTDVAYYGVNLFFDGKQNVSQPGISVFAQMDATGSGDGNPAYQANASASTIGWPYEATPGAGTLVYKDAVKKLKVTLTDFAVYHADVYNLDAVTAQDLGHPLDGPDGAADVIGQFTLNVEQNLSCEDVGVYYDGDVNRDCYVNLADIAELAGAWLTCYDPQGCN